MASNLLKALGGAVLLAAGSIVPASAQISWDPVDEVLGSIGITNKARPHIEYRERAPLVVPKGTALPPPQETSAIRGGRWPNDPDLLARRRAAEQARLPSTTDYEGRVVRDAKDRNRFAGVPTGASSLSSGDSFNPARAVSPETVRQLNAKAQADERLYTDYTEPPRALLTDPPRGYRAAQGGRQIRTTVDPLRRADELQINVNQPRN